MSDMHLWDFQATIRKEQSYHLETEDLNEKSDHFTFQNYLG